MILGKHLIDGTWKDGPGSFENEPVAGEPLSFCTGSSVLVDEACLAAQRDFRSYAGLSVEKRAEFLDKIADEIDALGTEITKYGCLETGLPEARLEGERGRTTGQLRLFANHIRDGSYLDHRHDGALPDRQPLPRPDLKLVQRPVGPVAVFGASNFPLAFSTGGGDTAAALAAGCPVVVKGHPAHPATGELVAQAIHAAIDKLDIPSGVFSLVQSNGIEEGTALVQHPAIRAVGFTGSLKAGRALFDLCAARAEPIPFFGELGSVNPMFILPHAQASRAEDIAKGWIGSLTMGAGQFCTNPGIVLLSSGAGAVEFENAALVAAKETGSQQMLTKNIASAFEKGTEQFSSQSGVRAVHSSESDIRHGNTHVFSVSAKDWLSNDILSEEVFGPVGLLVQCDNEAEMLEIAHNLHGQLTCTLHMDHEDSEIALKLLPILETKAGRLLANGYPTGVEVADAMVHGGPYPASTNFGATSVGTMSIRRFLRPVCYQNFPDELFEGVTGVSA